VTALAIIHALAVLGQGLLLSRIAGLSPSGPSGVLVAALVGALMLLAGFRFLPRRFDMLLAMLTVGGFGMTLGWWNDLRSAGGWCDSDAPLALFSWMNLGMLAAGLPAMRWLRRGCVPGLTLRSFLAPPCMVLGMRLGCWVARLAAPSLSNEGTILLEYALMLAGMLLGMLLASGPRRRARAQDFSALTRASSRSFCASTTSL
jgi:hypothetical protein